MKTTSKLQQVCSLLVCLLLLSSLAIVKYGEWMGHELKPKVETAKSVENDTVRTLADGSLVINTTSLGADIQGYAGKVPLEITVKDGKVMNVKALDNAETPDFFWPCPVRVTAGVGGLCFFGTTEHRSAEEVRAWQAQVWQAYRTVPAKYVT